MSLSVSLTVCLALIPAVALARGALLGYPPARREAPLLSAKEQAVIEASADAFFPSGGVLPISATEAGVIPYMNQTIEGAPPQTRLLLRLLFQFVEHGPWLFNLRSRFTRQSPEQRVATLQAWAESRFYFLRVTFTSLRTLVSLAYLADQRVIDRIGAVSNLAPFEVAP
jgi:hypothetical protein